MAPLDPETLLAELCRRHALDRRFGERLLPLLRRARTARPAVRERLLEVVEASFLREARRRAARRPDAPFAEEASLRTVAEVLHGWSPAAWLGGG